MGDAEITQSSRPFTERQEEDMSQEGDTSKELSKAGEWLIEVGRKLDEVGSKETGISHGSMWKVLGAEAVVLLGGGLFYTYGYDVKTYVGSLIDQIVESGYYEIDFGPGARSPWGGAVSAEQLARNFVEGAVSAEPHNLSERISETIRISPEGTANVTKGLRRLSEIRDETAIKILTAVAAGFFPQMVDAARGRLIDKSGQKVPISTTLQGVGKALQFIGEKI